MRRGGDKEGNLVPARADEDVVSGRASRRNVWAITSSDTIGQLTNPLDLTKETTAGDELPKNHTEAVVIDLEEIEEDQGKE